MANSSNDGISYYKEFIRGKDETCRTCSEARIKGRQPVEELFDICHNTAVMHVHIKQKLGEADKGLQRAYCSFADGLSAFHLLSRRYTLSEIGIGIKEGRLIC